LERVCIPGEERVPADRSLIPPDLQTQATTLLHPEKPGVGGSQTNLETFLDEAVLGELITRIFEALREGENIKGKNLESRAICTSFVCSTQEELIW
jgi:hypothetical protein